MFQESGAKFTTLDDVFLILSSLTVSFNFPLLKTGFEYWPDPGNCQDGFVNWQVNGQQTSSLCYAPAVGPDQGTRGTEVNT